MRLGEPCVVVVGVCSLVPFTEAERALDLSDFGGKKRKRGVGGGWGGHSYIASPRGK